MDDLSSSSRTFDSLSSFCRSFSRRPRPSSIHKPRVVSYAELAPMTVVTESAASYRALAIEQTESALDHFLELKHRLAEVRRRHENSQHFQEAGGSFGRSQAAIEEKRAWERWMNVIQRALRNAEDEIILAVRAWDEARRPSEVSDEFSRGVIYKGHLYLAVPTGDGNQHRLLVADLKSSLNLDRSLAVVDLMG
ncbi:hypothetical protein V5E97_22530 [Singulisphaera sp. Ch08]|uniref:Uncharacterized protein n=1 Tax=Singulisphaera sp. Ch08 TaxID=3120278 RepID=A0AAU7C7M8_9BACT